MKIGAAGALHAVIGPQSLRAITEFDLLEGQFSGMDGSEGVVVSGVPVLGEDDVLEMSRGAMDGSNDGVSIGNCKGAAGAEIVLDVDHEEDVV